MKQLVLRSGVLLAALPLLILGAPTASASAGWEFCGTRSDSRPVPQWGPTAIRAHGVSCRVAVRIGVRAEKRGTGRWTVGGWTCTYGVGSTPSPDLGPVQGLCQRGPKRIAYGWGH